ncbi:3-phosphoshikimate 1-carboxyvinyltransferase [Campylobacter lari]|uniref:3-phosphoshikimate 1-carboxyvinyltransferase n=1 Tax=Campylobacter lari TaxID=201 RepID=UPI0010598CD7|nr:3-phosphoshikimate 1-carboxyvinyltransferase [Campylobacter lari]EAI4440826.1 3-phosphoshikimate 1-carboxyvinyltransferase [Campylobacter lari]EDP6879592.1 3-phosphoshikimate 1-carboxyvinyltransferase [Campylobacter lari]TDJ89239.1 3-phosphoshikimate 1-carboxyvinyltransferase [Campylobacter lari]
MKISPIDSFKVELEDIASDKSISHRFAIFSLLTQGTCKIKNYLKAQDTLHTLAIIQALGAEVEEIDGLIYIKAPKYIKSPNCVLDCGNSGTAMRLLIGFLSAIEDEFFVLSGDCYLNARPMKRVSGPLMSLGAKIFGRANANLAPICIQGAKLDGFDFSSNIASAQVKSALILAALFAKKESYFKEVELSRDHSEIMLNKMGACIEYLNEDKTFIKINPLKEKLKAFEVCVPNDPSSAFYFALAACILPHSKVVLKNVLLNKTRIEAFKILEKMGAKITYNITNKDFESIGEICVESAPLKAVNVSENIAWLIDEIPALAIAFACAKGKSIIKNAKELRVKESDRIKSIVLNLQKCGIKVKEFEDGFEVEGGEVKNAKIESFGDHRIAMSFLILGLRCGMEVDDSECIKTSFPNFIEILKQIGAKIGD